MISTTWTYNAAHDLIQSVDALRHITGTLTYDPADGLTHLRVVSGTLVQHDDTLTQNGVGARTVLSDSVSGTVLGYGYDQAERLITATTGVTASSYAYDGNGLRQSKTVSGAAYTATWDLSGGLPTLLQENATRYVVGPGGLPLELVAGSTAYSYSYYQDQLGSTRGLLGATGRGVASASYSPYGVTGGYDGVYQPLGYAGQYTDAESGLQYLRARYYDPATAQFLTRDPLESLTGQPYAYAGDSPLNGVDPSGLTCFPFITPGGCQGPTWQQALATVQQIPGDAAHAVGDTGSEVAHRAVDFGVGTVTGASQLGSWLYRSSEINHVLDLQAYDQQWQQNYAVERAVLADPGRAVRTVAQATAAPIVCAIESGQPAYAVTYGTLTALTIYKAFDNLGALTRLGPVGAVRAGAQSLAQIRRVATVGGRSLRSLLGRGRPAQLAWNLPRFSRGRAIEDTILGRPATLMGQPLWNYPVIDDFNPVTGDAISVKSLDLLSPTYRNDPAEITSRLNHYAAALSNFQGRNWGGVNIQGFMIARRTLVVAFERGVATPDQQTEISNFVANVGSQYPTVTVDIRYIR